MEESSAPAMGYSGRPAIASRGRGRGRPPKWATILSPLHAVKANSPATAAASPPPTPTPSSPLEADADGSPSECRRSSRKKIIKFDVRDLLSKNRKAHKIQIEARIDSNPNTSINPSIVSSTAAPGSTPSAASNSNRLFSMFESSHQSLPPPPPPPHALEIFAKPRPTQSLIVAQVTSEPSASTVQTVAALPVVAVRKRGRPRKSTLAEMAAVAVPATAPTCSDSDTNSNSTSTSTSTGSGSGGEAAGAGAFAGFTKRKSKLRVSVKRLNLSRRLESSDSGDTPLNITVVGACTSPPSSSSSVGDPLVLQDENALDEQPEKLQQPLKELATIHVPGDNSDSDSQIIFIEIETSDTGKEDEQDQEPDLQERDQDQELLLPATCDVEEIEIDLDKQDSNPAPEQDLDEIMVEVLSEPPSLWSAEGDEDGEEAEARQAVPEEEPESNESSSQAPRRSRRSVPPRGGSRQGKTLEETFAEIAAESSKQILESEESQGPEEEQHVLIDLIEDDSQSEQEVEEVVKDKAEDPKEQELPPEAAVDKLELEIVTAETEATASADQTEREMEMLPESTEKAIVEPQENIEATITEPQPREDSTHQPQTETIEDSTKSLPETLPSEPEPYTKTVTVEPKPEAQQKLPVEAAKAEDLPLASIKPEEESRRRVTQQTGVENKQQTESEVEPTAQMSNDESDTPAPTELSRQGDQTEQIHSFSQQPATMSVPVAEDTKLASREPSPSSPASEVNVKKSKKEGLTKKPPGATGLGPEKKPTPSTLAERREPKKSLPAKREKLSEKISPAREMAQVNTKKGRTMDLESEVMSAKANKSVKSSSGSKREAEREKSSPESVGLHKKKEQRQSPTEREKETYQPDTAPTDPAKSESPKNEAGATKKPTSDNATPNKSKDKFFVECDAMFKAMDKANAQMRLEEKTKKKVKKVPALKVESPVPAVATASSSAVATKKSVIRKTAASCRRNTVYEDSPKLERSSSPGSDSTTIPIQVTTPAGKIKRTKSRSKLNSRRSTISEEARVREKATISPASVSSSDSSSKRNTAKRRDSTDPAKDNAASANPSKLELRRNTICEERQAEASPAIPLAKRRYSLHPKASADLLPAINKSAGKKRSKKVAAKVPLSRQDSLDSSSSASQGQTHPKKKILKSAGVHLEIEESSESSSSGSKTQPASPELEAPDALKDIAKFIEDGVNLLKRDYKLADEESQPAKEGQTEQEQEQEQVKQEAVAEEDEFSQRVANIETPETTLSPSPTQSNSEEPSTANNGGGGVRRSHRIKQKPQGPKASQGRGVTSMALAPISMDEQLAELANIEAINEQFLRSEGLNTFQALRENYYRCARQVSQENAEMQCDCFLTGDEEAQGHLCCGAGCINRMLMIECGPLCTNGDRCTNKRFQQHKCWPCRVFRTEKKGCGITAELQIPPGEFIMEYVGEVIDSEEFERRQHLYSKDRKRHYYFMALRGEAIIDATSKGNISRFINHSCDPNAETQKWTVNGELRIGFFSVKPIQPGEEITFDYQYQRYGKDAQRCYCEATNCRGWIGGEPDSDEGEQLDADSDSDAELEEEMELEQPEAADQDAGESRKITKVKLPSKSKVKVPSAAAVRKRKEQIKPKDREYKAGRWLKPSAAAGGGSGGAGEKAARKPKVSKFHAMLEDPDVLEELSLLSRSGLKNQLDTLRFSRCMVRAKLLQTRLQLLVVLTRGELPCRRLFLDYHGLRLLHAWISENGNDNQLRETLLDALESLPIPNRTMLNDSRVYQSVQLWSSSLEQPSSELDQSQSAMHKRTVALLQKWQALPEIFRIPKRERIEQMKEHEREADRQQKHALHASTALEDQREQRESTSDRYRQDRFRRDTASNRTSKPIRMSGNNTICTITTQPKGSNGSMDGLSGAGGNGGMIRNDNRRRSDLGGTPTEPRRTLSKELRRSLFERKVALDEAEKRVCSEDWREHELRCEFFGADLKTDTKQLPFYQNTETGEWFNSEDMLVPTPQRTEQQALALVSPEESEDGPAQAVEYKLPPGVDPLPSAWNWRITPDGDIYYYHLRERISQWEPPTAEQRLQTLLEEDATQQPLHELQNDPEVLANELIQVDTDYVGSLSSKSLAQYIEAKVRERRELRRNRLVSVRVISPRRDEDRLYNQLESRKYKENKEKIRRRKEIYRRRKPDGNLTAPTPTTDPDATSTNSLPIQGYLYSSDEEAADITAAVAGGEPLPIDGLVAKATKVDELDALNMEPSTSQAALAALATGSLLLGSKRKLPMPPHVPEMKKQRSDNRPKKIKGTVPPAKLREAQEKFRFDVSGLVAELLRPYRKESCKVGRICSDEDYKFLIKRLSQHITAKEMRYCDESGHALSCTESVRHKSYDFIHQYMRKKGRVYRKPAEPAPI
ncbi:hypothetical protein KR032_006148 [Drosophila birchii]|nr:hypothetical protein KR032_006148 [Drosophila birchii]